MIENNFKFLFQYLEKEEIKIDQSEFLFQLQSHPDYPSLLSISDTLSFFSIENGALNIAVSEISFLPNRFIALLNTQFITDVLEISISKASFSNEIFFVVRSWYNFVPSVIIFFC